MPSAATTEKTDVRVETKMERQAKHPQVDSLHRENSSIREDLRLYVNVDSIEAEGLKTSSDGRVVLIPQPSDSGNDPLNWSMTKKHVVLAVVIGCSFLPDYGSVMGAATLQAQAM